MTKLIKVSEIKTDRRCDLTLDEARFVDFTFPITVDENLNLLDGLRRLTAAKMLGATWIECKFADEFEFVYDPINYVGHYQI